MTECLKWIINEWIKWLNNIRFLYCFFSVIFVSTFFFFSIGFSSSTVGVECHDCFRVFASVPVLMEHIAAKHNRPEKRYKCSECSYSSSKSFNLKQHLMVHTGERPHKCPMCNKSFQRKSGLKTHVLSHNYP